MPRAADEILSGVLVLGKLFIEISEDQQLQVERLCLERIPPVIGRSCDYLRGESQINL
jgi:hypothetical protein